MVLMVSEADTAGAASAVSVIDILHASQAAAEGQTARLDRMSHPEAILATPLRKVGAAALKLFRRLRFLVDGRFSQLGQGLIGRLFFGQGLVKQLHGPS